MKRLLLLTAILLSACGYEIPFDEQDSNNTYLSCYFKSTWRNVILDKTHGTARSEWYFITSPGFEVMQTGEITKLRDNYDKSAYQWGHHNKDFYSSEFELDKTSLRLKVSLKINYSFGPEYKTKNFRCQLWDDYKAYSEWEVSLLETFERMATKERAQHTAAESAKKI